MQKKKKNSHHFLNNFKMGRLYFVKKKKKNECLAIVTEKTDINSEIVNYYS